MFLAWAVLSGLAGEYHTTDAANELARLQRREVTPAQWFMEACDEKFTDEDLNDEGNSFAANYYGEGEGLHTAEGSYLADYCDTFPFGNSLYEVEDSWVSFDALAPRIASHFDEWCGRRSYQPPHWPDALRIYAKALRIVVEPGLVAIVMLAAGVPWWAYILLLVLWAPLGRIRIRELRNGWLR